MEQQAGVCRTCARALSPDDTIVFAYGVLSHLDCRRPRALSAEERTLLFIYCRDHHESDPAACPGEARQSRVVETHMTMQRSFPDTNGSTKPFLERGQRIEAQTATALGSALLPLRAPAVRAILCTGRGK